MNEVTPAETLAAIRTSDDPTGYDIRSMMGSLLEQGFTDSACKSLKKKFDDIAYDIESDLMYTLKENIADNIAQYVCEMANKAIEELLSGNEGQMRLHLECREGHYTGRDTEHRVYSGKLAEYGGIALRHKIIETHAELLKNERILDLEAQLASVIKQKDGVDRLYRESRDALHLANSRLYHLGEGVP